MWSWLDSGPKSLKGYFQGDYSNMCGLYIRQCTTNIKTLGCDSIIVLTGRMPFVLRNTCWSILVIKCHSVCKLLWNGSWRRENVPETSTIKIYTEKQNKEANIVKCQHLEICIKGVRGLLWLFFNILRIWKFLKYKVKRRTCIYTYVYIYIYIISISSISIFISTCIL